MPRHAEPPRLQLCRKGSGIWYIVHFDDGRQRERSTRERDRGRAEEAFGEWLRSRRRRGAAAPPEEILIADVLAAYARRRQENATATDDLARLGYAIDALLPHWGARTVADVTGTTCQDYVRDRRGEIAAGKTRKAAAAWQRAHARAEAAGRSAPPRPRPVDPATVGAGTPRTELELLRAAIHDAVAHRELTVGVHVLLPEKPEPRQDWLTRQQAARLLWAARKVKGARHYLPLFILTALYVGRRKEAILGLAFERTPVGGLVDLDAGLIDFEVAGRPRTRKRRGRVPIPRQLLAALRRRRARDPGNPWVFTRDRSDRLAPGEAPRPVGDPKKGFAAAVAAAGLDRVTPHTLRHTCATWMMQDGLNAYDVAEWLKMSYRTLIETYGHHHPDFLSDVREHLERRGNAGSGRRGSRSIPEKRREPTGNKVA